MNSSLRNRTLTVVAITALLLAVLWLAVRREFGSVAAARAFLHGDEIAVLPTEVDLGDCERNGVQETQVQVVNLTGEPLTLTGIHTSCSCVVSTSLPAQLEAHAIFSLQLTIHSPDQAGSFRRAATLYTDSTISPSLPIQIVGHTRAAADENQALAAIGQATSDETNFHESDSPSNREPDLAIPTGAAGSATDSGDQK